MPWSGGTYTNIWSWVVDAITNPDILPSRFDTYEDDQASGINNCLTKDGQNVPTQNLPMATFRHTNVSNASARNQYSSAAQVQDSALVVANDSGVANVYALTLSPAITSYANNMVVWLRPANTNTTATATLNINGVGAKTIKMGAGDIGIGKIIQGHSYALQYDGTDFQIVGATPDAPAPVFADNLFRVAGSVDATKQVALEVDGLTTETTRTLTVQDVSGTILVTGGQDVPIADGGTGASTVAAARVNLGIATSPFVSSLLITNNVGTPNTRLTITANDCILLDNTFSGVRHTPVSLVLDAATVGANGLDVGVLSSNSWYSVYLISNGTDIASLLSLSSTAPALPTGYTYSLRVGSFRTDASAIFLRIIQRGRRSQYVVTASTNTASLPSMANGVSGDVTVPTWSAIAVANFIPPSADTIHANVVMATGGQTAIVAPNNSYGNFSSTTNAPFAISLATSSPSGATASNVTMSLESTNIYWASSSVGGRIYCVGWTEGI